MMPSLFTLAFPSISAANRHWIDQFRADHHMPDATMILPHFTLLFGCTEISEASYLAHVEAIASTTTEILFHCRYAMLGTDDNSASGYVFLVPDEGNSSISRLHDVLYTDLMLPYLRLDLAYIPHITIGKKKDRESARELCAQLNDTELSINGKLSALTVVKCTPDAIETLAQFPMTAQPYG